MGWMWWSGEYSTSRRKKKSLDDKLELEIYPKQTKIISQVISWAEHTFESYILVLSIGNNTQEAVMTQKFKRRNPDEVFNAK